MFNLAEELRDSNTWDYLLTVDPLVQVEFEQYDNWTAELLKQGFCWQGDYCTLDITFIEQDDRCQLQAFLDQHGLNYSVGFVLRAHEEIDDKDEAEL